MVTAARFGSGERTDIYSDAMTRDGFLLYLLARHFPERLSQLSSDALETLVKRVAVQAREQRPGMIPELRLVERCGDLMAGLGASSEGRLSSHTEPVNRVAAYSARSTASELEWAVFAFERKYAHTVFVIEDFEVEIGPEAQAALKGRVLDLIEERIITVAST